VAGLGLWQIPAGPARLASVLARMQQRNLLCCHIRVKVVKYNYHKENKANPAARPDAAGRNPAIPVGVIAC
jgi:hypothetical protein